MTPGRRMDEQFVEAIKSLWQAGVLAAEAGAAFNSAVRSFEGGPRMPNVLPERRQPVRVIRFGVKK